MSINIKSGKGPIRLTAGDKVFYVINTLVLGLLALIVRYPRYFIVIAATADPVAVPNGRVVLLIIANTTSKRFSENSLW